MSAEIVGPFEEYRLIVDGYSVPCVEARENDGGTVTFIVDKRLAWTIPAGAFDDVAHMVAHVYAVGLGLACAPSEEYGEPDGLKLVPVMMRPGRVRAIGAVRTEEAEPDDDPRA